MVRNTLVICVLVSFAYGEAGETLSLYSSVAEHWSCKPGVESSILSGGSSFFVLQIKLKI